MQLTFVLTFVNETIVPKYIKQLRTPARDVVLVLCIRIMHMLINKKTDY